jgi:hypothetical protein
MTNSKKPHEMAQLTENQYVTAKALASELRKDLKPLISRYIRVFTEPRKNGVRSKFWYTQGFVNPIEFDAVVSAFNNKYSNLATAEYGMSVGGGNMGRLYRSTHAADISIYVRMK